MTAPVHVLLSRLDRVRPAGDGKWYARCPAHDDKGPSLSVRDTGERVLVHCFAGCDPEDILAAVDLKWSDLYPDRDECARLRPIAGARKQAQQLLAAGDPLDIERTVLKIAAGAIERGEALSVEDQARVEVAFERLAVSS
jgi:hypothetical protein